MASGDTLIVFTAIHNEPPSTTPAPVTTRGGVLVINFVPQSSTLAEFGAVLPRSYQAGVSTGLTLTLGWGSTGQNTGNVVWDAFIERVNASGGDLDALAYGTAQTTGGVTPDINSGELTYSTITFTDGAQMDNLVEGEYFRLRIERDFDDASDDHLGTAQLVFVEIQET